MKRSLLYIIFCFFFLYTKGQNINAYQYWFDNNVSNSVTVNVPPTNNLDLQTSIDPISLAVGLHVLHLSFKQSDGAWSSITSDFFYKNSLSTTANNIMAYQYWFDNNISNSVTVNIAPASNLDLQTSIDPSNLTNGLHVFHITFKQSDGVWSSITSDFFYKDILPPAANNKLIKYRYWFDDKIQNAKEIILPGNVNYDLQNRLDCEELNLGKHLLSIQVKDIRGLWSSIIADSITRNPITTKIFIEPKVLVSKAVLNVGESQTITGNDFTANGVIQLFIRNSDGDFIETNSSFTYFANGSFSYQLPITSTMPHGEYQVYANDENTGIISPVIKFRVKNPVLKVLTVSEPSNGYYEINKPVQISWSDYVSAANAINNTGHIQKHYKIEYSDNNGTSWHIIEADHLETKVRSNQYNSFSKSYSFPQAGSYKIRVTDIDNLPDNNMGEAFTVSVPGSGSFTSSLGWDKSSLVLNSAPPIGLAADGTSRIIIKLTKDITNTKPVTKIHAVISASGSITGTQLLGKIKPAKVTNTYSEEANNANSTSCDTIFTTATINTDFSFWLVAPDDFTQTATSESADRNIQVSFIVTYVDNTTDALTPVNIKIVRPPLLMVHGLNSSGDDAWGKAKFDLGAGNGVKKFTDVINSRSIWKFGLIPDFLKYGSFSENAGILVSDAKNSFKAVIDSMHFRGIASCKVDYVCHSMGGCIARTAINHLPSYYSQKNYNKGYINKLITINTPHNGSYIGDFFIDNFRSINGGISPFVLHLAGELDGFYDPVHTDKASEAIYDLQAYDGGVTFNKTAGVKNHLIGSDIDQYNNTSLSKIDLDDLGTGIMLDLLKYATLPARYDKNIASYIAGEYDNNEYFSNTDVVVPVTSQLPDKNLITDVDIISKYFFTGHKANSIIYSDINSPFNLVYNVDASNISHTAITENLTVGSRVMFLLNSAINSSHFLDTIAPNPHPNGRVVYRGQSITDSIIFYADTLHAKIINPARNTNVYVDSTIDVNILISDTTGLRKVQLDFQGELYESYSKVNNQTFNVKVHSDAIGLNTILLKGIYDSSGFVNVHYDTATLKVLSADTLKGLYVTPKSQNLNRNHYFKLTYNAVYTNYVGVLNEDIDSLSFIIADTNVVRFIDSTRYFATKDTGTTYIVFNYKGFIDTAFIYVSEIQQTFVPLPVQLISFDGLPKAVFNLLQWKTSAEVNFSHFILQRSLNGNAWQNVARINSKLNSTTITNDYEYKDSVISNKTTFYRLLIVDIDGTAKTSNVVLIRRGSSSQDVKIFPNPVTKSEVFIDFGNSTSSANVIVNVVDLSGKVVKSINQNIPGNNIIRLDLTGLKPSVYLLKILRGDETQTIKLVVIE